MEKIELLKELVNLAECSNANARKRAKQKIAEDKQSKDKIIERLAYLDVIEGKCEETKHKIKIKESAVNAYQTEKNSLKLLERVRKRELDIKIKDENAKISDLRADVAIWECELDGGNTKRKLNEELEAIDKTLTDIQTSLKQKKDKIISMLYILSDTDVVREIEGNEEYIVSLGRCKHTAEEIRKKRLLNCNKLENYNLDFFTKANLGMNLEGKTVYFGNYMCKPCEWLVLAQKDNKLLLIAKSGLVRYQYNHKLTSTDWQSCEIRRWLNDIFINKAFTDNQKLLIRTTIVEPRPNPHYETECGSETEDKIFLLSIDEVNEYFKDDYSRCCICYDEERDCECDCRWWLRTPGFTSSGASCVNENGEINYYGYGVDHIYNYVRPAMWVN